MRDDVARPTGPLPQPHPRRALLLDLNVPVGGERRLRAVGQRQSGRGARPPSCHHSFGALRAMEREQEDARGRGRREPARQQQRPPPARLPLLPPRLRDPTEQPLLTHLAPDGLERRAQPGIRFHAASGRGACPPRRSAAWPWPARCRKDARRPAVSLRRRRAASRGCAAWRQRPQRLIELVCPLAAVRIGDVGRDQLDGRLEPSPAPLARHPPVDAPDGDAHQPGPKLRWLAQAAEGPGRVDEGLLKDVVDLGVIAEQTVGHARHVTDVPAVERLERVIAHGTSHLRGARLRHQRRVVGGDCARKAGVGARVHFRPQERRTTPVRLK